MALTTTIPQPNEKLFKDDRKDLPPPPEVAITPCDPWPRPYYLENGLRRVAPYHFTYNTYCKQRWRGREILDIFATEFRDRTREYYQKAIEEGRIVLNGTPCKDIHTIVQNGDVVSHTLHRHEPPVTAQPIRTIFEDDDMIVIDKPAGVPVHPAGRYRYNSIVEIMRAERSYAFNPLPCNRLDRLTSGVMFIGKTAQKAEGISQKLRERTVRKEYVARVKGRFPDGEGWEGSTMRGGVVKCEEAILQISPILGLNRARASGKTAKTLFRRIAYYGSRKSSESSPNNTHNNIMDPKTGTSAALPAPPTSGIEDEGYSIVHCLPLTGRTHQIRVHLQFLGHPISNDPIYSNRRVFGANLGRNENTDDNDAEIVERLSKMGKTEVAEAYSYTRDEERKEKRQSSSDSNGVTKFIDQTQKMAVSDYVVCQQQQQQQKPSTSNNRNNNTSSMTNTFKPLPQSLHAGTLPDSIISQIASGSTETQISNTDALYEAYVQAHDEAVADYNKRKGEKLTGEVCTICQTPLYSDPSPQELGIYLHAVAYADINGDWKYRSAMPEWAKPPTTTNINTNTNNTSPLSTGSSQDSSNFVTETIETGPTEVREWIYAGPGEEGLRIDIGDEKENETKKNEIGTKKNKGLLL